MTLKPILTRPRLAAAAQGTLSPETRPEATTGDLCRLLVSAGATCEALASTAAVSVSTCTATVLESSRSLDRFRTRIGAARARRRLVSVAIRSGDQGHGSAELAALFTALAESAAAAKTGPALIDVVVDARMASPRIVWQLRQAQLPGASLYFRAHGGWLNRRRNAGRHRSEFWTELWRLRNEPAVRLAPAAQVTSPCPLLAPESAECVLPVCGIQAPAGSAWVPVVIDLLRFADSRGELDWPRLEFALTAAVELGDSLHDVLSWERSDLHRDARLNRRLGICITGIGDLVRLRGQDPALFVTLKDMDQLLGAMKDLLVARSHALAKSRATLPAIRTSEPGSRLPAGSIAHGWHARWRDAVSDTALAHRNLFVLSPWSLFPAGQFAANEFANLVPVLTLADACALREPRSLANWTLEQYRCFYQHLWAVLRQKDNGKQIAEQV